MNSMRFAPEEILGMVAYSANIIDTPQPISLTELLSEIEHLY